MGTIDIRWRTNPYSENGGNCAEVAQDSDGVILVRDTRDHGRSPVQRYTIAEWRAFTAGIRNNEFDADETGHLVQISGLRPRAGASGC